MTNFFEELKRFVELYKHEKDEFFVWEESKISYDLAVEIYSSYFMMRDDYAGCIETIEEQRDFIRLLREENKRLRGSNENAE